jgi:hypothetical protein
LRPTLVALCLCQTLYPNPDRGCGRQEELISGMRANAYNLPEPARSWYKQLIDESTRRVGLRSYVPWNVVREVLTCREVHGRPFPPSIDETYYQDIIRFCGLLWGQWCVALCSFQHPSRHFLQVYGYMRFISDLTLLGGPRIWYVCPTTRYRNPEMLRLGMGRFLGEMMEHMKAGLDGSSPYKMVVFSGTVQLAATYLYTHAPRLLPKSVPTCSRIALRFIGR